MSEQLTLPAEARDRAGKGASRALRRDGRVPAVVYGEKKEPLSIHVEEKLLSKMLHTGHFMNSVVMIDFEGKPHRTLPKAVDFHPVSSRPIHVDFLRIGEHTKVTSPCRCASTMKKPRRASSAAAFSTSSSTSSSWSATRRASRTRSTSTLDGLEIGDSIHISQVKLPEGVMPANQDEDFTVATIVAPSAMKAEEEEAAAEGEVPTVGEEGEEGAEGEGGEAAEGASRRISLSAAANFRNRSPSPRAGGFFLRGAHARGRRCNCGSALAIRAPNMRFSGTMSASWRPTSSPRCMISARGRRNSGA